MKKSILLIIILNLIFSGCQGNQIRKEENTENNNIEEMKSDCPEPNWVKKPPQDDEENEYFVGMSTKKSERKFSREEAERDADNKFITYCGVDKEYIDEYITKVLKKDLNETVISDGKVFSKSRSEAFVRDIKAVDWYECEYKYKDTKQNRITGSNWSAMVLVSVPKEEIKRVRDYAEKKIKEKDMKIIESENKIIENEKKQKEIEIKKVGSQIKEIIALNKSLEDYKNNGKIILALKNINKLIKMIDDINKEPNLSEALKEEKIDLLPSINLLDIEKNNIIQNIMIGKVSNKGQTVSVGEQIKEPFVVALKYIIDNEKKYPLINVPVTFSLLSGSNKIKLEDVSTNDKGEAGFNAYEISTKDEGKIVVLAELINNNEILKEVKFIVNVEKVTKEENSPIAKLFNIKQNNSEFNIEIWTDKSEYLVGEFISFYLKATRDCYVTLIDQATSNEVSVLFPNKFSQDNFIKAGKEYVIPGENYGFKMKVSGPSGIERIKAFASTKPVKIIDMDFNKPFYEVDTRNISILRSIEVLPDELSKTLWTDSIHKIRILEKDKKNSERGLEEETKDGNPKPSSTIGSIEVWDSTEYKKDKKSRGLDEESNENMPKPIRAGGSVDFLDSTENKKN